MLPRRGFADAVRLNQLPAAFMFILAQCMAAWQAAMAAAAPSARKRNTSCRNRGAISNPMPRAPAICRPTASERCGKAARLVSNHPVPSSPPPWQDRFTLESSARSWVEQACPRAECIGKRPTMQAISVPSRPKAKSAHVGPGRLCRVALPDQGAPGAIEVRRFDD